LYSERDYSARAIPPLYNRLCDIIYFKKLIRFVFFLYFLPMYIYFSPVHSIWYYVFKTSFPRRLRNDRCSLLIHTHTHTRGNAHTDTLTHSITHPTHSLSHTHTHMYTYIHTYIQHTSTDTMGLAYSSYVNVCPMINRILIYSWICCCSRMSNERPLVPIGYFYLNSKLKVLFTKLDIIIWLISSINSQSHCDDDNVKKMI